jgi:hypothetical protein
VRDVGLRQVVEHEPLAREARAERCRGRELARTDQEVVREALVLERRDAAHERRTQDERVVRLVLDDVTDTDERPAAEALHLRGRILRLQVDPADDAADERVLLGEIQQELRLAERLARLYRHDPADAHGRRERRQVVREEVAAQRRQRVVDPRVLRGVVAPEVDVRVDPHPAGSSR